LAVEKYLINMCSFEWFPLTEVILQEGRFTDTFIGWRIIDCSRKYLGFGLSYLGCWSLEPSQEWCSFHLLSNIFRHSETKSKYSRI